MRILSKNTKISKYHKNFMTESNFYFYIFAARNVRLIPLFVSYELHGSKRSHTTVFLTKKNIQSKSLNRGD